MCVSEVFFFYFYNLQPHLLAEMIYFPQYNALIPKCFILGSDVVDWLYNHVEGFTDRREARKYASNLLKAGYIRHTVNKITFSEQCYYIFGDLCGSMYSNRTSLSFVDYGYC